MKRDPLFYLCAAICVAGFFAAIYASGLLCPAYACPPRIVQ